jgi:hypothetical protein
MPSRHPDPDQLADLAADVLPIRTARRIEHHVRDCGECRALLADAEHIRELLLADDPGPVPDDVWTRIESALTAEVNARNERPVLTVLDGDGGAAENPSAARTGSGPAAVDVLPTPPDGADRHLLPFPRRGGEDQSGFSALLARKGSLLAVAAGMLTLLGLGGTVLSHLIPRDAETYAESAPANLDSTHRRVPPAAVPVSQTGTNYTPSQLATQIRALLATVAAPSMTTGGTLGSTRPDGSATTSTTGVHSPAGDRASGWVQLTDPRALQGCLEAIGAGDADPLAVDLARFRQREAALIVLPGRNGGQEVWAVARDCRPGADGTMYYRMLAS